MKDMKILVAGDLLPQPSNQELFEQGQTNELFGKELVELFVKNDFKVANLEGPLTENDIMIKKSGPNLRASEKSIHGIVEMGFDAVSLANNHILDYGEEGLQSTMRILKENSIQFFGAGKNLVEAKKSFIFERRGYKIGFYACAEYEFTIATERRAGANPFDSLEIMDDISNLKAKTDYVIVMYHGGKELYQYPVPYVRKRCRKLVEKGADLVLCQHSHCIGCKEKYNDGVILYGQGNFCFNRISDDLRNTGLLVQISLPQKHITYLPVCRTKMGVCLAQGNKRKEILDAFEERSEKIQKEGFVERQYEIFSLEMMSRYEACTMGWIGKIFYKMHMKAILDAFYRKKDRITILNILRCEAHRDLYCKGLEKAIKR